MPILNVVLILIVIGVLLWLVGMIPMDGTIQKIIRVVVIIAVVLWLLSVFGLLSGIGNIRLGG
jgi:uncharacterized membrane protein